MGATISCPPAERRNVGTTKTGTYAGNGADNRNIDIGVDLASKANVTVMVKATDNAQAVWRTEYGQGDLSYFFDATADAANCIQSFTATGFQIGDDNKVNSGARTYRWAAFWMEP